MAAEIDSFEVFITLSSKITQLLYGRKKDDRSLIKKTLDELNSINYNYRVILIPTKAVLLLHQCCSLIPPEDTELVVKCCHLITSLILKQMVVVEGRTLTIAINWCLEALKYNRDVIDILQALETLQQVNKNQELTADVMKAVIDVVNNQKDFDSVLAALQCLETCTRCHDEDPSDKFHAHLQTSFDIFLNHLLEFKNEAKTINEVKILTACLNGIQNVITQRSDILKDNTGVILGIIRTYMLYNLRGIDFIAPLKLLPSALSVPEPSPNINPREKGGKLTKLRKQRSNSSKPKNITEDSEHSGGYTPANPMNTDLNESLGQFCRLKTSDSDFSDTEGGNLAKLAITAGRTRQSALSLLLYITKAIDKNVMFSYWSTFIPENLQCAKHNLSTCILKDTSARGRVIALQVLLSLITNAKLYLAQAEKGESLAFTPFSVIIGLMIKELHKCLSLALTEHSIPVLAQVFKCWAALVQATPYHKLAAGLITKTIRNVKVFIHHKDVTIQVAALIVLGCALASEPCVMETRLAFVQKIDDPAESTPRLDGNSSDGDEFAAFSSDDEGDRPTRTESLLPWLLDKVLANLDEDNVTTVKLESLQVVSAMCRNHFDSLLVPHLPFVAKTLNSVLSDRKYPDVQLHAGRAIDFIGQAMTRHLNTKVLPLGDGLAFWLNLLDGELTALLQIDDSPVLRAVGCDCLGSIGPLIFDRFPRDKQILVITLLFSASRDDENNVKGAAVRALGISILYPSLREDPGFIVDVSETIYRLIGDGNLNVRIKSSWSLGNLSEALALNKSNPNLLEEFPKDQLLKLLKITIKSAENNDKIRMNIVRALGSFLNLITEDLLKISEIKGLVESSFLVLIKNSTTGSNMKVRWNSCYALGNAMKNPTLFSSTLQWKQLVFHNLCDLVVNFRNFKVRINASNALSSPLLRTHYDSYYFTIWIALIKALETSQNMEDFTEYKHRDHLVEQICLSLGHLASLLDKDDLVSFKDNVELDYEFLKGHVKKVWDRLLPEKSTVLYDAQTHLNSLGNDLHLSDNQKITLKLLTSVFRQDI